MFKDIPCVILCGGRSSRMMQDKSLLPFGKYSTLIEYQYRKMSKIFSKVYISSKINKFDFNCDIIYDNSDNISSPMIALDSILKFLNYEKTFIIPVDTPFVEQITINTIIEQSFNFDITIAKDVEKIHNLCGVFSKTTLPKISNMILNNNHKINFLLNSVDHNIIEFSNNEQFININDKADYKKANIIGKRIFKADLIKF